VLLAIAAVAGALAWWFAKGLRWHSPRDYLEAQRWGSFVVSLGSSVVFLVLAIVKALG
jgi:ABC-type Fe3+ transport system permease subunit